jgi:L-malate glycosyltransferase
MKIALIGFGSSFHLLKWSKELVRSHEISVYLIGNDLRGFSDLPVVVNQVRFSPISMLRLVNRIYAHKYDIVHIHYLGKTIIFAFLLLFHNALIISLYGSDILVKAKASRLFRYLLLRVCRYSRAVQCTSEHMKEEYLSLGGFKDNLAVIPFGVDESVFSDSIGNYKPKEFTFGIVKKMEVVYNVELFLDAFVILAKKYSGLKCLVYGGGSMLDKFKCRYIGESIVFHGWIPNDEVPIAYSRMHVAVIPSLSESFGVSAIEAAMCGVPVIASRVGGLPETVEEGKVGVLFESKNLLDLTVKMEEMLIDREKYTAIRDQCRNTVLAKYSIDRTTRLQNELYNEIIK